MWVRSQQRFWGGALRTGSPVTPAPGVTGDDRRDLTRIADQHDLRAERLPVVTTSVLDDASLAHLKTEAWRLTGLIGVYVRDGGNPFALVAGSTVLDVAAAIHSDLVRDFRGARVSGPSARFAGQRVGRDHVVLELSTSAELPAPRKKLR
jgi:ribosome-interacting GTPase 1